MKTNAVLITLTSIFVIALVSCKPSSEVKVSFDKDIKNDSLLVDTASPDMQNQTISIGEASFVKARISFPAGKIKVNSGNSELMVGNFKYTKNEWKPEISYTEEGENGNLIIEPKNSINNVSFNDNDTCKWYIDLSPEKEYDMEVMIGAGKGDIDLENFLLKNFKFEMGAGQVNLNLKNTSVPKLEIAVGAGKAIVDLTGDWKNDLTAKMAGGVGEIEVHLPKEVGVIAEVNGLLGGVDADDFTKKGRKYINSSYGKTEYTLNLQIDGAIGKVKLILQ